MNSLTRLVFALLIAAAAPAFAQQPAISPEEQAILDEEARLEAEEATVEASANANDPTAPNPAPAFPELRPVLDEFGGEAGLTALMETFMAGLLADPRTQPFFANADQVRVKRQLTEQFCVILGGDCTYTGRDMRTSHAGQNIDRGHFNALVEVLQAAMAAQGIAFAQQNRLLALLAPMHRDIITVR